MIIDMSYSEYSLYEGQFFENKQHGFGVFKGIDGKTYRGSWECGKKHGFGDQSNYFMRRKWDYFVKNLKGIEPPKNFSLDK